MKLVIEDLNRDLVFHEAVTNGSEDKYMDVIMSTTKDRIRMIIDKEEAGKIISHLKESFFPEELSGSSDEYRRGDGKFVKLVHDLVEDKMKEVVRRGAEAIKWTSNSSY